MTTLEKLIFCKQHGIAMSYVASRAEVAPATITRWINGDKGISRKNERDIDLALLQLAKEIWQTIGEDYDRNL